MVFSKTFTAFVSLNLDPVKKSSLLGLETFTIATLILDVNLLRVKEEVEIKTDRKMKVQGQALNLARFWFLS